jgi:glycosyltransferase involved in cell wall biosynthesis
MMRVAMITSWGTACGIAEYSRYLMDAAIRIEPIEFHVLAPDELASDRGCAYPVTRCWMPRSLDFRAVADRVNDIEPDLVHIQFQWAYYSSASLSALLTAVRSTGRPVIVTFHTTADLEQQADSLSRAREMLGQADLLLVHTPRDVNRVSEWGLDSNVRLIGIGNFVAADEDPVRVRAALGLSGLAPIIAGFGFLQPHKGILESIESVAILREKHPDILYVAVSAVQKNPESMAYRLACLKRARELGVADWALVLGRFLSNSEVLAVLHASDLVVLPYHPTSESASAL